MTSSDEPQWKHLTLQQAVTLTSNASNLTTPNNEQHINGQHSNTDYSYDIDFGQLHIASNLNTPQSMTSNIISGSYDSISIPSNLNTPTATTSHFHHTPCSNRSQVSNYNNSRSSYNYNYNINPTPSHQHLHAISRSHTASHSLSIASNSNSNSNSNTTSKTRRTHSKSTIAKNKRNKEQSPGHKFATEFYKKGKVKSVMRGNCIIGQFEAKLMLAYFRNVEVENIESSDIALRYLESKSVRHLKRSLREMNETIRRSFYYGSDFTHIHEQALLGNDNIDTLHINNHSKNSNNNNNDSVSLQPITENMASTPNIENNNNAANGSYVNLGDLTNDSYSGSLDDYLQSPNTTYTPSTNDKHHSFNFKSQSSFTDIVKAVNNDNNNNNNNNNNNTKQSDIIFNPLKGAQNVTLKQKQPLKGFKKNFANKYFHANNSNNNSHNMEYKNDDELPSELPYIDEKHSFWNENEHKQQQQEQVKKEENELLGNQRRQSSQTKMFGKFFDKRGSDISHSSIWSESESDGDNEYNSDDSEDPYVLTKFHSEQSESMTLDDTDGIGIGGNIDIGVNPYPLSKTNSLDVPTPTTKGNKPPNKAGKEHISQFSFASTVSLGSDYASDDEHGAIISPKNSTILPIHEDTEFEHNDNDINKLVTTTSLKIKRSGSNKNNKKSLKNRKYNKDGKEMDDNNNKNIENKPRKPHLLKIDSLLLNPENQPEPKHDANYSLDSFLSDMEIPEPTAVEKLKYHLTEPRLPPSRRKTYNYSHI